MKKIRLIGVLTLMPSRRAVCMFSDTARILMPRVVAFTNQARPSISARAKRMMKIWVSVTIAPKTSNETAGTRAGNGSGRRLTNSITRFCRMMATPSALSIGANREAPRSGR
jgi:hypothetical protein